jgi:methionyl-tRNA formyltransferase
MNIVFMGTPDFAAASLQKIAESRHRILAVVTAADKPKGRGLHLQASPVKIAAENLGVPVLQPPSLKDPAFTVILREFDADLFVVVAFRILPEAVFSLPKCGAINLHASLLPRYRGAAPINWAIIRGETETGVTTFFLKEKVDTGNMILQERVDIPQDMTAGELHDRLAVVGADMLVRTIDAVEDGTLTLLQQCDEEATSAPKIFRDTCRISWEWNAKQVHDFIRGLSPNPKAWTRCGETMIKISRSILTQASMVSVPGTVLESRHKLCIACRAGAVEILELQQEGRKLMTAAEFLRGYPLHEGDLFC